MAGLGDIKNLLPAQGGLPMQDGVSAQGGLPAQDGGMDIEFDEEPDDVPVTNDKGEVIQIEHADGAITVSIDGAPLEKPSNGDAVEGWFANLAEEIEADERARIADELIRGIEEDITSRKEWIDNRATGMRMLGLKLELPGSAGDAEGAPVEGMSKVRHPLLLEAVLRFQANARGELLPADGPVKIRNDDNNATQQEDALADALERDLNHYLTSVASEYYPDTDRMFLMLGFGGTTFKKVHYCPLKMRPVSETVDAADLIVNNMASDLSNARRVTHRIIMRPSVVKRMQIVGAYREADLGTAKDVELNEVDREKLDQEGLSQSFTMNPDDKDREIYECYCELNIQGYEHKYKGKVSGLEVPYRVTIDVSSREILSIVRNYDEKTKELPTARKVFVKYSYVPGFGFYDIGLLHILGNTTNALTAAWREMLDNGMYANFPGFIVAKSAMRQNSNIFRVPPGGGVPIDTNGQPIQTQIMAMPYNAQAMPALQNLVQSIESTGQRVGGTSEVGVGDGQADVPVGTMLAAIDQASKVESAVHKRLHSAQAEEFRLLCRLFQEHPSSFWERNAKPTIPWDEATFLKALEDYDLVPQADPNTSSHTQRVMKVMGLKQLQQQNPTLYNAVAVDTAAIQTLGFSNPQQFFVSQQQLTSPPPEMAKELAEAQNEQARIQIEQFNAETKRQEANAKIQQGFFTKPMHGDGGGQVSDNGAPSEVDYMQAHNDAIDAQAKMLDAHTRAQQVAMDHAHHHADRLDQHHAMGLDFLSDLLGHQVDYAKIAQARDASNESKKGDKS
jgi:hypothetical protein